VREILRRIEYLAAGVPAVFPDQPSVTFVTRQAQHTSLDLCPSLLANIQKNFNGAAQVRGKRVILEFLDACAELAKQHPQLNQEGTRCGAAVMPDSD